MASPRRYRHWAGNWICAWSKSDAFDGEASWAKTAHYDRDATGAAKDSLDTVLFTDGVKRVIQTKKDATVAGREVMIVSGKTEFDALGRSTKQFYPITEPKDAAPRATASSTLASIKASIPHPWNTTCSTAT
jgi:hypothetical protein